VYGNEMYDDFDEVRAQRRPVYRNLSRLCPEDLLDAAMANEARTGRNRRRRVHAAALAVAW
jgi:hypothetical protein